MLLGILGGLLCVVIIVAWFVFIRMKILPDSNKIKYLHIVYNESIGDLLPDDYESKEFKVTVRHEIEIIRKHIGNLPVSKVPLVKSDILDDGPNWIINLYFSNGDFRYIIVDKKQISGKAAESSPLYKYLKNKYT